MELGEHSPGQGVSAEAPIVLCERPHPHLTGPFSIWCECTALRVGCHMESTRAQDPQPVRIASRVAIARSSCTSSRPRAAAQESAR